MSARAMTLASLLAFAPAAMAGFDATSSKMVSVYWGQNSAGGATTQDRLSTYCQNSEVDIIPLAFMNGINPPIVNFASASDSCTPLPSGLLSCPDIAADIATCQAAGKTILLSIGGATYSQGGFPSTDDAATQAENVWAMFGPNQNNGADRPFGDSVVDGFDFDFEAATNNLAAFGSKLRDLMDAAHAGGDKQYYLTAAPQCPFPDAVDGDTLNAVNFDAVFVQFYNNYCGVSSYVAGSTTQNNYNIATWDDWAKNTSPNKDVKVLVGVPASAGAGGGFVQDLSGVLGFSKGYSSFGGVMVWDMSQLYANNGYLDSIVADLA